MNRDRWTLFLFKEGDPEAVRLDLDLPWIRVGVGIASLAVLALCSSLTLVYQGGAQFEATALEQENRILTSELGEMRSRVEQLETRITTLSSEGSRFRALAGLEPIPSEVFQVGIGGPGTDVPESHPLHKTNPGLSAIAFAVEYDVNALERRARLLATSLREATDSLMAQRDLLESTPSILPTPGLLSSGFSTSRYHPIHHRPLPHEGVDIAAPAGTPILAAAKGRIATAEWQPGYGLLVEIDHGYGFRTRYGHADQILVREGQQVERGDVIARVGESGIATAPNLHYEVLVGGRPTNPMNYVLSGAAP